jgi:ATP-dependent helicase/DNAse subunit B
VVYDDIIGYMDESGTRDKFKAIWLSHSSINDFLKCPRLYFLHNRYKDLRTSHKISVISPALTLGQVVHTVIESLSGIPREERFADSPIDKFESAWKKVSGQIGGFENPEQENTYKERGLKMIKTIIEKPGPLVNKAIKLKSENGLSSFWFSEDKNLILCGKVDWIEYLPKTDSIHIIDFKTGRLEEEEESLQLPIYYLLTKNLQKRKIAKASYWYLDNGKGLVQKQLPNEELAIEKINKIADRISLALKLDHFKCPSNGCKHCYPYERILKGEGKWVGISEYKQDIYILNRPQPEI